MSREFNNSLSALGLLRIGWADKKKIYRTGIGLALLLLGSIGLASYWMDRSIESNRQKVEKTYQVLQELDELEESFEYARHAQQDHAMLQPAKYATEIQAASQASRSSLAVLQLLMVENDRQKQRLIRLNWLAQKYFETLQSANSSPPTNSPRSLLPTPTPSATSLDGRENESERLRQELQGLLIATTSQEQWLLSQRTQALEHNLNMIHRSNFLGYGLSFGLLLSIYGLLEKEVRQQQKDQMSARRFAEEVQDLYNHAPCGYHSLDINGRYVRVNDTELSWLGYQREELMGRPLADFITPKTLPNFQQGFQCLKQRGVVKDVEVELIRKDGSTFLATLSATYIQDAAGDYLMCRATLFDITDRRKAEIALRDNEELLRQVTENLKDVVWVKDLDIQRTIYISPVYQKIWQRDREEVYQDHGVWLRTIHPEDLPELERSLKEDLVQGTYQPEYRIVRPDGSTRWIRDRAFPVPDHQGVVHRIVGIAEDITERKQAEADLQAARNRLQTILENMQLMVVSLDISGQVQYVNPFFLQTMGYAEHEVMGEDWVSHFLPTSERQRVDTVFTEILQQTNSHKHFQNSILTKSGELRLIAWSNTLLREASGTIIGMVGIGQDITERQMVEKMKAEFVSIVSHELRTPLTAIRGSLGLLAAGVYDQKPDKARRMVQVAAEQSERLVRLINDILDLQRLESGKIKLELQACDASFLLQQAVETMRPSAEQSEIALRIQSDPVSVWASADAIQQVLTNLLSNAIKFSPTGSTIDLSVQQLAAAKGEPSLVLFRVQDQGRGIPPKHLETIFEQFQQVDTSDARHKGGTGLGLAICRRLIEQHGGRIWAESVLGQGSSFYFTVPTVPTVLTLSQGAVD